MKQLLDFLPVILFFLLYKFYMDLPAGLIDTFNALIPYAQLSYGEQADAIYLATLAAIFATIVQVSFIALLTRKIEKLPLVMLALLIVFGGATLLLKDPLYIQWKPTVINWLFGLVLLASHFVGDKPLIQRMMSMAINIEDQRVWNQLNLAWAGFFVISGIANALVAPQIDPFGLRFSEETWVEFKLFGLMGMTIAFVIIQAIFIARNLPDYRDQNEETS